MLHYSRVWKTVEDDPSDFTGWTYLLQFVDNHGNLDEGREAFDAFLFKYPYCYGYWKKFGDFEKRLGTKEICSKESCVAVFERGVKAIPLSADLWIHFMNYLRAEFSADEELIRKTYERAVKACGREWRSDKLWDHFVKWESSLQEAAETKDFRRVLKLYDQILANPTQGLASQFDMFREFVKDHNPKDMLEAADFLALRKEVLAALCGGDKAGNKETEDDDAEAAPGDVSSGVRAEEENLAMKEKIIYERRKIFKETESKAQPRWKFEEAIKRPYFHIKPLESLQLKNWSEYLEFELKQDDHDAAEVLFERCLIACALYEEFWVKYTDWMSDRLKRATEDSKKAELVEKLRDIYSRGCTHHLPNNVEIHLAWSALEESQGNFDGAIEILEKIEKIHPKLMSVACRRINAVRRSGNLALAHSLYKEQIDSAKSPSQRVDWTIKLARSLRFSSNQAEAVRVLREALLIDEKNPKLYLQLLDVYLHQLPLNESKIVEVFDTALMAQEMGVRDKLLFSQRKVEFLEEFGSDVNAVLAAQAECAKLAVELKPKIAESEQAAQPPHSTSAKTNGAAPSSTSTTYPAANSSSYAAYQNSQYQQYGSRYAGAQSYQYPSNYYSGYNY